ncbi:hypothetical protein NC652_032399 [Populus alba x Populus x berolinensis]|nr:hypothetical protein NC652_032399 [Populus alba x Populus x berolinensis]
MERDNSTRLDLDSDAQLLGGTAEMLLLARVMASCNELQLSCERRAYLLQPHKLPDLELFTECYFSRSSLSESSHQCQRRPLALSGLSPLPPVLGSWLLCAWVSGVSTLHGREAKIEHGKNGASKETDKGEKAAAKSLSFHRQR